MKTTWISRAFKRHLRPFLGLSLHSGSTSLQLQICMSRLATLALKASLLEKRESTNKAAQILAETITKTKIWQRRVQLVTKSKSKKSTRWNSLRVCARRQCRSLRLPKARSWAQTIFHLSIRWLTHTRHGVLNCRLKPKLRLKIKVI